MAVAGPGASSPRRRQRERPDSTIPWRNAHFFDFFFFFSAFMFIDRGRAGPPAPWRRPVRVPTTTATGWPADSLVGTVRLSPSAAPRARSTAQTWSDRKERAASQLAGVASGLVCIISNTRADLVNFQEFMTQKNDASHFVLGTNSKKRPNNLVMGRTYDGHLLDMFELGMEDFKALEDFKIPKIPVGTKPMLLFAGEQFEQNKDLERLKNFLIDFFRGETAEAISLQGLEHVIMFTAADNKITLRSYKVLLKKSGTKTPRVELEEIGPRADLTLRRTKIASEDLFKTARKQPKQNKVKKKKNIEKTALGATMGRIHMEKQDFNKLQTRKLKGLKKTPEEKKAARAAKKAAARAAAKSEDTPMDVDT
ncbi:hypothetical protein HPB51_015873 [Rhipicephalus microplus]|uniref:Ribosome production factor 2 homolog n=1 Tax=Rhipicephalus microplus TaxID=6941 RepID=A0A9J6DH56_RHIMP|nr:hypothetical protein HPB51_015873 [Rhipicephalus microplus]